MDPSWNSHSLQWFWWVTEFFSTKCGGGEDCSLFQGSMMPGKGSLMKDEGSWRSASCKASVTLLSVDVEGSSITCFQNWDLSPCRGWDLSRHNCELKYQASLCCAVLVTNASERWVKLESDYWGTSLRVDTNGYTNEIIFPSYTQITWQLSG